MHYMIMQSKYFPMFYTFFHAFIYLFTLIFTASIYEKYVLKIFPKHYRSFFYYFLFPVCKHNIF